MLLKDAVQGMLLKEIGLVIEIGSPGTNEIYKEDYWIRFFELEDAWYGSGSREMDPTQEVEELYARGTKEYKKAVQYILEDRVDCEISAHDDIILLRAFKTYAHEPKEKDNV